MSTRPVWTGWKIRSDDPAGRVELVVRRHDGRRHLTFIGTSLSAFRTDRPTPWSDPERNSLRQLSLRGFRQLAGIGSWWQEKPTIYVYRGILFGESLSLISTACGSPEPIFFGKTTV